MPDYRGTGVLSVIVTVVLGSPAFAGTPPWEPAYKIKPQETHRLTRADVIGPDGIVYPDWTYAGVPGGIAAVAERSRAGDFGAVADDDRDDSQAIRRGVESIAAAGGGALILGPGIYHLDRPVILSCDGVVIRGQGADTTKLVFRYGSPEGGVGFFQLEEGAVVGPDTPLEVHAAPDGLRRLAILADGRILSERVRHQHWGGTACPRR